MKVYMLTLTLVALALLSVAAPVVAKTHQESDESTLGCSSGVVPKQDVPNMTPLARPKLPSADSSEDCGSCQNCVTCCICYCDSGILCSAICISACPGS